MDSVHENNVPLPGAEKHNFRQDALTRFAAFALLATLAAAETRNPGADMPADEAYRPVSAATYVLPGIDQLSELERGYLSKPKLDNIEQKATKGGPDYAPHVYDLEASNESTIVYRHEGLEGISFARPSLEANKKILEADSIESLEASAAPFFKSLGINLYMTQPHPDIKDDIVELGPEDLENTRGALLATIGEIAFTPREVINLANVADVVFANRMPIKKGKGTASGLAYLRSNQPGTIALDVSGGDSTWQADVWNHELGHHAAHAMDEATDGAFSRDFAKLNKQGFMYKDRLLMGDAVDVAIQRWQRQGALDKSVIISDYSAESVAEDEAESFTSLWRGEMAPNDLDKSFGTLLGTKRVLWTESINRFVPNFRKYLVGMSTDSIYAQEGIVSNAKDAIYK